MKGCVTRILYILIFEINCVLYSGSTTKQIQISQNVDATTIAQLHLQQKSITNWLTQIQTIQAQ